MYVYVCHLSRRRTIHIHLKHLKGGAELTLYIHIQIYLSIDLSVYLYLYPSQSIYLSIYLRWKMYAFRERSNVTCCATALSTLSSSIWNAAPSSRASIFPVRLASSWTKTARTWSAICGWRAFT